MAGQDGAVLGNDHVAVDPMLLDGGHQVSPLALRMAPVVPRVRLQALQVCQLSLVQLWLGAGGHRPPSFIASPSFRWILDFSSRMSGPVTAVRERGSAPTPAPAVGNRVGLASSPLSLSASRLSPPLFVSCPYCLGK